MIEDYYDKASSLKQEAVARTEDMTQQRRIVRSYLALRTGENVLDVGSGNGILAREMLQDVGESGRVVGIDPAESMISLSQNLCPGASFLRGDATALPIGTGEFDAATASQVLCFVPDVDAALAEMFRALKPKGRLVILDTDWGSLVWNCSNQGLLESVVAELMKPYACGFVPRTLSRRLVSAGFQITYRTAHPIVNWDLVEGTYSAQLASFLPEHSDAASEIRGGLSAAWSAEQSAVAAKGGYLFSLNRYIFCASKPKWPTPRRLP